MKLDPEERATLMRLLIESVDADSEDGTERFLNRSRADTGCVHCYV